MYYDNLTDEQLAKHINTGIAELRARQKKQQEEMAEFHKRLLLEATSQDSGRKRPGRKPKGGANAAAA